MSKKHTIATVYSTSILPELGGGHLKCADLDGLSLVASKRPAMAGHHPEHITLTHGEVVAHASGSSNLNGAETPLQPYAQCMIHYYLVSDVLDLLGVEPAEYENELLMDKSRVRINSNGDDFFVKKHSTFVSPTCDDGGEILRSMLLFPPFIFIMEPNFTFILLCQLLCNTFS
jgi:hypothetical protein